MYEQFESWEKIETPKGTFELHFFVDLGYLQCHIKQYTIKVFDRENYEVRKYYVSKHNRACGIFRIHIHQNLVSTCCPENYETTPARIIYETIDIGVEDKIIGTEKSISDVMNINNIDVNKFIEYSKELLKAKIINYLSSPNIVKLTKEENDEVSRKDT